MLETTCPSHDELAAYTLGRLPEETSEAIAAHLGSCPACKAGLVTFDDPEDTFVTQLRKPAVTDPCLQEPQCQEAVARAQAVRGQAAFAPGRTDEALRGGFLGE